MAFSVTDLLGDIASINFKFPAKENNCKNPFSFPMN